MNFVLKVNITRRVLSEVETLFYFIACISENKTVFVASLLLFYKTKVNNKTKYQEKTHKYIYIYIECVCACVCVCLFSLFVFLCNDELKGTQSHFFPFFASQAENKTQDIFVCFVVQQDDLCLYIKQSPSPDQFRT